MRAVDTNVLVRLLVRDDEAQARSAQTFIAAGAWVSHLVLLETTWVLDSIYNRNPKQIAASIAKLLQHETLVIEQADVVLSALVAFRKAPVLGFGDCLVLEVARKAGHVPLATFDRTLAKLEGTQRLT
jgi:predicted nucleic-acid-binding protein